MRAKGICLIAIVTFVLPAALADIVIPGIDPANLGTDGDLILTGSHQTIDLSLAADGDWDSIPPVPGQGVYDAEKWAVVFKYNSVDINLINHNYNLYFNNHPSGAPVVWLVSGDVNIRKGTINLLGQNEISQTGFPEPGPGGFRGARGKLGEIPASGGFGPGGGEFVLDVGTGGGAYELPGNTQGTVGPAYPYGNAFILPLIGGSGGGPRWDGGSDDGGGAGGGAILIVAQGAINIDGSARIYCQGGYSHYGGGGSGGAIRLIGDTVTVDGQLRATGGATSWAQAPHGTDGRIFVQANQWTLNDAGDPVAVTTDFNASPFYVWPPDSSDPNPAPKLSTVSLVLADATVIPIPDDPRASLDFPFSDLEFDTMDDVTLNIAAEYVPLTWTVVVRVVAKAGNTQRFFAQPLNGTLESSTTTATLSLPRGFGAIQVLAFDPDAR